MRSVFSPLLSHTFKNNYLKHETLISFAMMLKDSMGEGTSVFFCKCIFDRYCIEDF